MTPKQAGEFEIFEPDWRERFEEHRLRWPNLPRYLAEDSAFEATLTDWRRFFGTPMIVAKQAKIKPAPAADGMIALAKLRIFPPRFLIKDIPCDGVYGYQQDDHMWLSIAGEQWRIKAIEDRTMLLERGFSEDAPETKQIDLSKAKWNKYVDAAVMMLEAMRENEKGPPESAEGP
jgi:hypothetical protein